MVSSALPLLVTGVRDANHAHHALAADHLALHANLLHRSTDLHRPLLDSEMIDHPGSAPRTAALAKAAGATPVPERARLFNRRDPMCQGSRTSSSSSGTSFRAFRMA